MRNDARNRLARAAARSRMRLLLAVCLLLPALAAAAAPELRYLDSGQWTFNQDCAVLGDTVVTTLAFGIQSWDVTDPAAPVMLDDLYTGTHKPYRLDWEGDLVAFTTTAGHLYLVDASDAADLQTRIIAMGTGASPDVALRRDGATRWCYTAGDAGSDFQIYDVTDMGSFVARGTLTLSGKGNSIAVLGDTLLVLTRSTGAGLYAVDVTDPDNPVQRGSVALSGTLANVDADGPRAAVAAAGDGFYTFDVSNPASPVQRALVSPTVNPTYANLSVKSVVVSGTRLYALTGDGGPLIYDITDLASPVLIGYDPQLDPEPNIPPYYTFNDARILGDRLYACHWSGLESGVTVFDVSAPASLARLGMTDAFDYVRFVAARGDVVFGCTGHQGIFAHELVNVVGDFYELVRRGNFFLDATWGAQAHNDTLYIASTHEGLIIADFGDLDAPTEIGRVDPGQVRCVDVHGSVAYLATYNNGFFTVNVSDPTNPQVLDSAMHDPSQECVGVQVQGTVAVTADRADGMNLWNVADPENIVHLANYPTGGTAESVALKDDMAFLAVAGEGVHRVDISIPASPAYQETFASGASGCAVVESYLHVSLGTGGVAAYHVVDAADPIWLADFASPNNSLAICGSGSRVFVAGYAGLVALNLDPDTPTALVAFDLAWDGAGVTVRWELAEAADAGDLRVLVRRPGEPAGTGAALAVTAEDATRFLARDTRPELAAGGTWLYALELREAGGDWLVLHSQSLSVPAAPAAVARLDCYPNPFNPATTLRIDGADGRRVRLAVHDAAGRLVRVLHEGVVAGASLAIAWDGRDEAGRELPAGIYLARLAGSGIADTKKLVLVK
ncbi:MAG: hypothetical protein JW819_05090 [Candidatus Krumholzibacteriota bacterium]|nr:hypothetical protein [Candidatus Krumholzibacteriota bacterium]